MSKRGSKSALLLGKVKDFSKSKNSKKSKKKKRKLAGWLYKQPDKTKKVEPKIKGKSKRTKVKKEKITYEKTFSYSISDLKKKFNKGK